MKVHLVIGFIMCTSSAYALARETIPQCDPQYVSQDDLQPYKYKTYAIAGSEKTGRLAEDLFSSIPVISNNPDIHRDRFGVVFFEERERQKRGIPVNVRYQLIESTYCRKAATETRCIDFCMVALTILPGDHD